LLVNLSKARNKESAEVTFYNYLSTSVSNMIPRSALLSSTALVIACMAVLSSGFGMWLGNIPDD
jgi:hypothetical protein